MKNINKLALVAIIATVGAKASENNDVTDLNGAPEVGQQQVTDTAAEAAAEAQRLAAEEARRNDEAETKFMGDMFTVSDEDAARGKDRVNERIAADEAKRRFAEEARQKAKDKLDLRAQKKPSSIELLGDARRDFRSGNDAYQAKPVDSAIRLKSILEKGTLVSNTEDAQKYFPLLDGKFVDPYVLGRIDAALRNFTTSKFKEFDDAKKVIEDFKAKTNQLDAASKSTVKVVDTWRKFKDSSKEKNEAAANDFWNDVNTSPRRGR
jgi:hypothetical protein